MALDEDNPHRGEGDRECCLKRMTNLQSAELSHLLMEAIYPLCKELEKREVCSACTAKTVFQTMLLIAAKDGGLSPEHALCAFNEAFNSVYEPEGTRLAGAMLETRDTNRGH